MDAAFFLLPRPPFEVTPEKKSAFEDLYNSTIAGSVIEYHLPYPKWQYLSYLCETKDLVLHGSQDQNITEVEPRQANDRREFSNQKAIYATTDGIWVIYFAILDRKGYSKLTLFNSCLRVRLSPGQVSEPMYFFSITHSVLLKQPWCQGMIYILPRPSFEQEASQEMHGMEIIFPHWISDIPVNPLARLPVGPQDFPFLKQIHGHDDEKLVTMATQDPGGFPWADALVS